jgi:hypothetical protein
MFILNGKPLSPDVAFTHNGVQYPANWLRLSSPAERAAIGITEEPDPPTYDQRFYWGVGNPKDLAQLKTQWIAQTKATAGSLISPTDWVIIRSVEPGGRAAAQSILQERSRIRTASDTKEAAINATTTVDELAAYITGPDYNNWSQ